MLKIITRSICLGSLACLLSGSLFLAPVQATPKEIEITLTSGSLDYYSLIERAEAAARAAISVGFAADEQIQEVIVVILGEKGGQISPLLSVTVQRSAWEQEQNLRPWIRYFTSAQVLLGYRQVSSPTTNSSSPTSPNNSNQTNTSPPPQSKIPEIPERNTSDLNFDDELD